MKKVTIIEASVKPEKERKRRVAAYCRVSTDTDDQLLSLETQKAHYRQFIAANPAWEYAGIYYDEGISGTKKETRPALQQMISDCEAGKIDQIVTKSLSRFARNTTDCLELVRNLLNMGIPVYFEKENLDTGSMDSELLLSIMSSLAESESVSISENARWSVRRRFENGTYRASSAPYGYTVKDGVFSVNEDEAQWVRFIFAEALAGKSSYTIADELNEKQVSAKKGGPWSGSSVRGILKNEKYIGDCLLQKTYTDFRFRRHRNDDDLDKIYIQDHHEAIISRGDYEAANAMTRRHAAEKNVAQDDKKYIQRYPFTGRLECLWCRAPLKRRIHRSGSQCYATWACREHLADRSGCPLKAIREDTLENAFTTMMNKLIFARKDILLDLQNTLRRQSLEKSMHRLNEIEAALEELDGRRQTLAEFLAKGYLDQPAFTKESNALQAETDSLKKEKEWLAVNIGGDLRKTEALREIIRFTGRGEMSESFDAELFDRFVDHVLVCSREEIMFFLKCGLRLTERIG